MPRKQKRGSDGKRTPWYSKGAEIAHATAVDQVRQVSGFDPLSGRTVVDCDALVGVYFQEPGYSLRITPGADGEAWYKCGIPGRDGSRYYLLVQRLKHELHSTALVNLCEKIQEVWNGTLKPSPDIWNG